MNRPLVGITATSATWDGRRRAGIDAAYAEAVASLGGEPVLLPPAPGPFAHARIGGHLDALVLAGGEDVSPERYGMAMSPLVGAVHPLRDESDVAALRVALERDVPILAICRGAQLLNAVLGGTLWQDLTTERAGSDEHDEWQDRTARTHQVRLRLPSKLFSAVGEATIAVNSIHHQGVRTLAADLVATAWADDGLIEGFELPTRRWVVGVQWHPEELSLESAAARPLAALVAEASSRLVSAAEAAPLAARA